MTGGLQQTQAKSPSIWKAITPSDTDDIPKVGGRGPRRIYATGAGNIVMTDTDGNDATFAFAAAQTRELSPTRIKATGTTATTIIGLW